MAESTADATAANPDTLRRELKKVVAEIFDDGRGTNDRGQTDGSFGVVEAIDEAIGILTCLRKVESKTSPESDIPSSSPSQSQSQSASLEVPNEFICTLSKKIMIEPVIIASGQTYEKKYIKEWLKHERTCPKSKEVLSHCLWTQNHLANELITKWCLVNKFNRQKPSDVIVTELFTDDIASLLQRISSSSCSSVADQIEAAKELRCQTKKFPNVRDFFVAQLPDSITKLLSPLSASGEAVDSNPELQENLITALFNISLSETNKRVIAENPIVIPLLTKSLKQGTMQTRRNSAATLVSLSVIDSNSLIIGNSEILKALIVLIKEGDFLATSEAASAVFNLCIEVENREKAVLAGLIPVLANKIREGSNVDKLLAVLALVSTQNQAIEELGKLGFIYDLFGILRNPSCSLSCENAVVIVYNMCERNRDRSRIIVVGEEEKQNGTFTKLAKQGTERAVRKAQGILQWIKKLAAGKGRQW